MGRIGHLRHLRLLLVGQLLEWFVLLRQFRHGKRQSGTVTLGYKRVTLDAGAVDAHDLYPARPDENPLNHSRGAAHRLAVHQHAVLPGIRRLIDQFNRTVGDSLSGKRSQQLCRQRIGHGKRLKEGLGHCFPFQHHLILLAIVDGE